MEKMITKLLNNGQEEKLLKDYRFYIILPICLAMPSFIMLLVLLFINHLLLNSKNWGPFSMAQSFMVLFNTYCSNALFFSGFLVDKFTSRKVIPFT